MLDQRVNRRVAQQMEIVDHDRQLSADLVEVTSQDLGLIDWRQQRWYVGVLWSRTGTLLRRISIQLDITDHY